VFSKGIQWEKNYTQIRLKIRILEVIILGLGPVWLPLTSFILETIRDRSTLVEKHCKESKQKNPIKNGL